MVCLFVCVYVCVMGLIQEGEKTAITIKGMVKTSPIQSYITVKHDARRINEQN